MQSNNALNVKNVSFKFPYEPKRAPHAFKDVSFSIAEREFVSIVGPSGCGKSTLVDLIVGLYPPAEGKVLVDGHDLHNITLGDWRRSIGFVSQNAYIFSGTIEENIAFGSEEGSVDQDRLKEAAEVAGFLEVIERLPNGYQTEVGEKGFKLSGGERQRLAIARAVYKNPSIFIFDEATSNLDSYSERKIQQAIEILKANGKTLIVIAHRLSTIANADEILVMREGQMIEKGRHDQLMKLNGFYSELHHTQHASFTPLSSQ